MDGEHLVQTLWDIRTSHDFCVSSKFKTTLGFCSNTPHTMYVKAMCFLAEILFRVFLIALRWPQPFVKNLDVHFERSLQNHFIRILWHPDIVPYGVQLIRELFRDLTVYCDSPPSLHRDKAKSRDLGHQYTNLSVSCENAACNLYC